MRKIVTAAMWASGHIILAESAPDGSLPLMTGDRASLEMILDGNTDSPMALPSGDSAWALSSITAAETPAERYTLVMLWLAKMARLYSDLNVTMHVNQAANRQVRRETARVINTKLN